MAFRTFRPLVRQLENRETPAGNVVGSLANGVWTLTGDDLDNAIQLKQVGAGLYQVVGLSGTTVTGDGSQTPVGGVASIKIVMNGGNDRVAFESGVVVNGNLSIHLGDGHNELDTSGGIGVAGIMTIQAGHGYDKLLVNANVGANLTVHTGDGGSQAVYRGTINGSSKISGGAGSDHLTLDTLSIKGSSGAVFSLGGGNNAISIKNTTTVDNGHFTVTGAALNFNIASASSLTVSKDVKLNMGRNGSFLPEGNLTSRDLQLTSNGLLIATPGSASSVISVSRDLTLSSVTQTFVQLPGTLNVGRHFRFVGGNYFNRFSVAKGLTVGGDALFQLRDGSARIELVGTTAHTISGKLAITGGIDTTIRLDNLTVSKNVSMNLSKFNGLDNVTLGTSFGVKIGGNLAIATGTDDDEITLYGVTVNGITTLKTGIGADLIRIDDSQFLKATTIMTGLGDDEILIEQRTGTSSTTTFNGLTLKAGDGNDRMALGFFSDSTRQVQFKGLVLLDGENGWNTFNFNAAAPGDSNTLGSFTYIKWNLPI